MCPHREPLAKRSRLQKEVSDKSRIHTTSKNEIASRTKPINHILDVTWNEPPPLGPPSSRTSCAKRSLQKEVSMRHSGFIEFMRQLSCS